MTPRKYDMSRRGAAAEGTRRRIVDATLELHSSQGIAATRWDQIAARAGVGVGTVYRHFPSLDELIPACGRRAMEVLDLPAVSDVPDLYAGVEDPRGRIDRLVGEVFARYERAGQAVRTTLREEGVHPGVARDAAEIRAVLDTMVDVALEPLGADPHERRVARAMVDIGTWTALREQGLEPLEAVEVAAAMLASRFGHH